MVRPVSAAALAFAALALLPAHAQPAFSERLELQGVAFHVTCDNAGSLNTLRIVPSGRLNKPVVIEQQIDGKVVGAEVADLDRNGVPEIYVYVQSAGSGSYGSVVGHAVNKRRTITPIYMPELAEDPKAAAGYMGHDRFAVVEGWMVRTFPVYRPGDTNAAPSGGTRQLQYRLVSGEASWLLRLDRSKTQTFDACDSCRPDAKAGTARDPRQTAAQGPPGEQARTRSIAPAPSPGVPDARAVECSRAKREQARAERAASECREPSPLCEALRSSLSTKHDPAVAQACGDPDGPAKGADCQAAKSALRDAETRARDCRDSSDARCAALRSGVGLKNKEVAAACGGS